MKRIIPVLAVAALLVTGCGADKNKISEKKFDEEIGQYGFILNRNAKYEGSAVLFGQNATMTVEASSDGTNIAYCTRFVVDGVAGAMESYLIGKFENERISGTWYHTENTASSTWSVDTTPEGGITLEEFGPTLVESSYFVAFNYKELEYNSKEKAYQAKRIDKAVDMGGPDGTLAIIFRDVSLKFEKNEMIAWSYEMTSMGQPIQIDMERTVVGGIEVVAPTIS